MIWLSRGRARTVASLALGLTALLLETAQPPAARAQAGEAAAARSVSRESQPTALASVAVQRLQARPIRGLSADTAARILTGQPGGTLPIEVLAVAAPSPGAAKVSLFVEIDGPSLLREDRRRRLQLEIYVYALRKDRSLAAYLAEVVTTSAELGEAIFDSGLKFFGHLPLDAGDYDLRILVRSSPESIALRQVSVTVPPPSSDTLVALIEEPANRDAWPRVEQGRGRGTAATRPSFVVGGQPLRPSARPILISGKPASLWIFAPRLEGTGQRCRVQILAANTTAGEPDRLPRDGGTRCRIDHEPGPAEAGLQSLQVRFEPPRLPPADYRLQVLLGDGANARASEPVNILLLQGRTKERDLRWTDLRWLVTPDDPTSRPRIAAAPRLKKGSSVRKVQAGYKAALGALAGGASDAAQSALYESESAILGQDSARGMETLGKAENKVAQQLAARNAESLVPLIELHTRLYREYARRRIFSLSAHSKERIVTLAETYAANGGSALIAAQALTSLGGYQQDASLPSGSTRFFTKALIFEPNSPAALLGLGSLYEKYGEYRKAIGVLDTLVDGHPQNSEALLRLGVNLCRVKSTRCPAMLRLALDSEPPDWVRALAYESLALHLVEEGQPQEAALVLEPAFEELPELLHPQLAMAHVYDLLNRPADATRLVRQRFFLRSSDQPSPRLLYDRWPKKALEDDRESLRSAALDRQPVLAKALAELTN